MIFILFQVISSSFYQHQFRQKLDHYNTQTHEYFNQTFLTDLYLNITRNSILVILGKFSRISKNLANSKALLDLKQKTNARIIILEHRFFGNSLPIGGLTKENRNFLMIHQALADIDYFLEYVHNNFCPKSNCNIGLIGSGYAGSLAAWSRVRYPHLTIGTWASSAPLNMMPEFSYYDEFYAKKLKTEDKCLNSTKYVLDQIEQIIDNGDKKEIEKLKGMFDFLPEQDNISLLYAIAEVLSLPLQQPNPTYYAHKFCNEITENKTIDKLSSLYHTFLTEFNKNASHFDPLLYKQFPDLQSRLWLQCNQIGWFHTSSGKLRSKKINLSYFNRVCHHTFGINVSNSTISNSAFGGTNPYLSNAIFTNGDEDPYKVLSVQNNVESMGRFSFDIKGAGRSADLYSNEEYDQIYLENTQLRTNRKKSLKTQSSDPNSVSNQCVTQISQWISHYCRNNCKKGTCILSNCVCEKFWDGEFCNRRSHTLGAYSIISAVCILAPTLILLFFGMFVLLCGTREDAEIDNSRKSYFT